MEKWRKIFQKMLFPSAWIVILLVLVSCIALPLVFIRGMDQHIFGYAVYALSFYALVIGVLFSIYSLPSYYRSIRAYIYKNPFGNRYMTDSVFHSRVTLYTSLSINMMYVAIYLVAGYWYQTHWFALLSLYYAILSIMRWVLVRYQQRHELGNNLDGEYRCYRTCAIIMLSINVVLSGVVLMMMYQNRGYSYPGVLIYVMALYAFYAITRSIINMIKYKKYNSPVISATKSVSFASAMVSMLALETAMLTAFGADMTLDTKQLMIALTGGGISLVLIGLSIYQIYHGTVEIKKLDPGRVT